MGVWSLVLSLLACCVLPALPLTIDQRLEKLEKINCQLIRQLIGYQINQEEILRSTGDSGIKIVRQRTDGTKPYHVAHHSSYSFMSIHNHDDHHHTVGMGEFSAVLNGVEFRTRHNDYMLTKPSTTSSDYHAVEDIPYPAVPDAVTALTNVTEQTAEMKEWFRAWAEEDNSTRNYEDHFVPLLCYLEAAWTSDAYNLSEPFESDRHSLSASNWHDLLDQARFYSYTGSKDNLENSAYLPTSIMTVAEDGSPVFSQWNYRILCHPIQNRELKLSRSSLKLIDTLSTRIKRTKNYEQYAKSRAARFSVSSVGDEDTEHYWGLLDELMKEVPGMDNYMANLTDDTFGLTKHDPITNLSQNTGFYSRWYELTEKGAMGDTIGHRAFNDRNAFMAETTHPQVSPLTYNYCTDPNDNSTCSPITKRMTYAIPLEILYLTPLHAWNPYNIPYKGDKQSDEGKTVFADGRNGDLTVDKAWNGTNSKTFYRAPSEFFVGGTVEGDTADTSKQKRGVLDAQGNLRVVATSGCRIHLPVIEGLEDLGELRMRYPIAPVHAEGSTAWKEMEALRDLTLDMASYSKYFKVEPPYVKDTSSPSDTSSDTSSNTTASPWASYKAILRTNMSASATGEPHEHIIPLKTWQYTATYTDGLKRVINSTIALGHSHEIRVYYSSGEFRLDKCDGVKLTACPEHGEILTSEIIQQ